MSRTNARNPVNQYNKVDIHAKAEEATPHRLIQMLFMGALEKLAAAKGHLQHGNVAEKCGFITWAIDIIQGLQGSLDLEVGGEIAERLDGLYEYMQLQLVKANADNDVAKIDEVIKLLTTIKQGWDAIPAEFHNPPQQESTQAEAGQTGNDNSTPDNSP